MLDTFGNLIMKQYLKNWTGGRTS